MMILSWFAVTILVAYLVYQKGYEDGYWVANGECFDKYEYRKDDNES